AARSYLDATEDGSSPFAPTAHLALEHLTPGDGAWSGAVGLTSIPQQMFLPGDIVPVLVEHRSELDDLIGAGADVDRATIDFYLAGALLNLRRFDEGTDVFRRSAEVMETIEPTSLIRLWSASGAAIGQTLTGDADAAVGTL